MVDKFIAVLVLYFLLIASSSAAEIAGVKLADQVQLSDNGATLILNGAGIRSKFFLKIYVAGLYLSEKSGTTAEILEMAGAKRLSMHFLYDEVSKQKLIDGWNQGFEENQDKATMENLRARLDQFNQFFETVHSGDVITLDYLPNSGTSVNINNTKKGTIPGDDFNRALLAVWLGEEPADSDLKSGLLGE